MLFAHCANGRYGGIEMASFIYDLAGADYFKFIFTSICYLVGVPLYLIALVFIMLH